MFKLSYFKYLTTVFIIVMCVSFAMDRPPQSGQAQQPKNLFMHKRGTTTGEIETDPVKRLQNIIWDIYTKPHDPSNSQYLRAFEAMLKKYPHMVNQPVFSNGRTSLLIHLSELPLIGWAPSDHSAYLQLIRLVLQVGADVNKEFNGKTALNIAIDNIQPQIVKILLNAHADFTHRDSSGRTALMQALDAINLYPEYTDRIYNIVEYLLQAGALDSTDTMKSAIEIINRTPPQLRNQFLPLLDEYNKKKLG